MITNPKAKQKKKRRGREGTISLNLEHMFWKSNLHMESGGALAEGSRGCGLAGEQRAVALETVLANRKITGA